MGLVGLASRLTGRLDWSIAVVVFTVPPKRLREMDVALGPCVPIANRRRPLVGPLGQQYGETPKMTAALLTALTGAPSDNALTLIENRGKGRLSACSEPFVRAMAAANAHLIELADEDDARGDRDLPTFVRKQSEHELAWRNAVRWPRGTPNIPDRLVRMASARVALERDQPLYCWHGPARPMVTVISGKGPYSRR